MSNLAIITARGGSKRIPRKNIKSFLDKPIIAYSIEAAIASKLFDTIMVSTDDSEIAKIATQYGAEVPFLRTQKTSDDFATLSDVILEVLDTYKTIGKNFKNVCCLLPTAPFISSAKIKEGYTAITKGFDSVFPITEFSYPIQRSLKLKDNTVSMVWEEHINTRSQDLPKRYHDSGQWYWLKSTSFLKERKLFMKNSSGILISELEGQDIDTETDWKLAELKYQLLHNG